MRQHNALRPLRHATFGGRTKDAGGGPGESGTGNPPVRSQLQCEWGVFVFFLAW